jgi:two-component system phosphate regulon sensor histidine kinase PhoR
LTEQARDRNVLLRSIDIPAATVFGDRDALTRVFTNLIENSIRYTPSGGNIIVGGWKQDTAVCISIEDTGIGIPPESLPNIFDRFFRVDKARTREAGGTGLGLAIVKAIVDAHGGDVTVESHVGKGSKFTVVLPLAATARVAVNVG